MRELLETLVSIEVIADKLRRRGVSLEAYLGACNAEGDFPLYCAYLNQVGEDLDIRLAHDEHGLRALFADGEEPRYKELHFNKAMKAALAQIDAQGFASGQLLGGEEPLYNLDDKGTKIEVGVPHGDAGSCSGSRSQGHEHSALQRSWVK